MTYDVRVSFEFQWRGPRLLFVRCSHAQRIFNDGVTPENRLATSLLYACPRASVIRDTSVGFASRSDFGSQRR